VIGFVIGNHRNGFKTDFTVAMNGTPAAPQAVGLLDARWGTAELLGGGTDLLTRVMPAGRLQEAMAHSLYRHP